MASGILDQEGFRSLYRRVKRDLFFFADQCKFEPTWQQKDVMDIVQKEHDLPVEFRKKRVAVRSGQGPGKTALSVVIALWRTFRGPGALTMVTAPTMNQLKEVWMAEFRARLQVMHPSLASIIHPQRTKVVFGDFIRYQDWGLKLVTATKAPNLQGRHQEDMTWIVDEASGIPRELFEVIKGTLTNDNSFLFEIGNPNTCDCDFYDAFFGPMAHMYHHYCMNSEESPIVSQQNVRAIAEEFGRNSDVYRIRVKGEFPLGDPRCLISKEEIAVIMQGLADEPPRDRRFEGDCKKVFGIDFARYGSDENVIVVRQGNEVLEMRHYAKRDPNDVVEEAYEMQDSLGWDNEDCYYVVDAGGMGQGIVGNIHRTGRKCFEFHNNGVSSNREYRNKVTEGFCHLVKQIRKGAIKLPKDMRLIEQLASRQYSTVDLKGRTCVEIESKEKYIKRRGSSPDRADGFLMCFYPNAVVENQIYIPERKRRIVGMGYFRRGM